MPLLWAGRKGPASYTRYFALGMQLSPALQSPFSFHLGCGYDIKYKNKYFSLPLAPPTGNKEKYGWLARLVSKMAGRRQAFQNNPELQRFVLHGVHPTGRQLGVGSYGSVEELEMNGLLCAGKRLHEALLEQGNAGVAEISRKYLLECQVTSI